MSAKWDAYFWRDAPNVLKNKLGIKTPAELKFHEEQIVRARATDVPQAGAPDLRFEHLADIHRHLFQDVYEWAGKVRDVPLAKDLTQFVPPSHIKDLAAEFDKSLRTDPVSGKNDMVERMVYAQVSLDRIHPFREGNGRATRAFIRQYARALGYEYAVAKAHADKGRWVDANAYAIVGGITKPLQHIFAENLKPLEKEKSTLAAVPDTGRGEGRKG